MKNIGIGILIGILISAGLAFAGRQYLVKTEIKIKEVKIEDTIWKDKYLQLQQKLSKMPKKITEAEKEKISVDDLSNLIWCYNSPLDFAHYTDHNFVYVTVTDGCKEAKAQYKIKVIQKGNWKVYLTIGVIGVTSGILLYHLTK